MEQTTKEVGNWSVSQHREHRDPTMFFRIRLAAVFRFRIVDLRFKSKTD